MLRIVSTYRVPTAQLRLAVAKDNEKTPSINRRFWKFDSTGFCTQANPISTAHRLAYPAATAMAVGLLHAPYPVLP